MSWLTERVLESLNRIFLVSAISALFLRMLKSLKKSIKDSLENNNIEIAIIAVPPNSAQKVTDILVDAGIKVIMNYTSVPIKVPSKVKIQTTDPIEKLLHTLYYLSHTGYAEYK